ncbi:RagB/SusD family nutrient uptake outer membrane protein [Pedobacter sp. SYP-B3415]|uniref:RagB/SusD family nutrient uptake outer membrane protein n=1 Tax=Pedobacter sp. SYP-B3415 TaxID=2496641 RepID=UPI00101DAA4A|nr:RagB/SusD family nutrient uptake outer membrane protein [Pedobacter sp. SYP-B3415]
MKNLVKYSVVVLLGAQLVVSCKNFLEVSPKGTMLESNYYRNQSEAYNGLVAVYDVLGWQGNGYVSKIPAANSASDDHYAGGGSSTDINAFQVWSNYTLNAANGPQEELWRKGYSGIFRANVLLSKLDGVPMDAGLKSRYAAEAKALRAFFYFDLVRLFRNIPLLLTAVETSQLYNVEQSTPAAVYAQIEKDLNEAIPALPVTVALATEGGRLSQGAAKAILGKVLLQQEKFAAAAAAFQDVNGTPGTTSQYGYRLLANFADLWNVNNKFNTESIIELSATTTSAGDWGCAACTEGNHMNILVGPRGYKPGANAPDYVSGWSFNPVTKSLFDAIHFDPRNKATIANLDSLKAVGAADYEPGYMNTGYFLEKFAGREKNKTTGAGAKELNFGQNMYEIRLADTYLMEAEALLRAGTPNTRAAALFNAVRARVGLNPLPLNMDNLMNERRLELAGEGHRWFDLVRTGRAPAVLGARGFIAGKHEVLPIPLRELENTKLKQNPNY